jgi:CRP-like cAMP-binding protein
MPEFSGSGKTRVVYPHIYNAIPFDPSSRPAHFGVSNMNLRHIKALAALSDADLVVVAPFLQMIDLPSGASVVEYGDVSEDMYFVVRGSAIMRRGELVLGKLKEGDHFGELGLIAHRPRAATIMADAPLTVARLGRERFDELQALRPAIAVKLMSGLIITLGRQLVDRTESLHLLLNQRSLPRQATITMTREDKSETEVKTGSVLAEVLPDKMGDSPVVAALVDHRVTSLDAQLFSDVHVEPLTAENWEGERVLRHSLALLIVEAAQDFSPPLQLKLGFAVGSAQWMHIEGKVPYTLQEIADKLTRRIRELIAQRADFRQEWWSIDEALSYFRKHHQSDAVQLLKGARSLTTPLVTCGRIYALYNGPLLPHAGLISEFRIKAGLNSLVLLSGEDTEVPPRL